MPDTHQPALSRVITPAGLAHLDPKAQPGYVPPSSQAVIAAAVKEWEAACMTAQQDTVTRLAASLGLRPDVVAREWAMARLVANYGKDGELMRHGRTDD